MQIKTKLATLSCSVQPFLTITENSKQLKCQTIGGCLSKLWHFHTVTVNKMMCLNNFQRRGEAHDSNIRWKKKNAALYIRKTLTLQIHLIIESICKESYWYAYICVGRVYMWLWLPPFRFSHLICKLPHRPCPNNKTQSGRKKQINIKM